MMDFRGDVCRASRPYARSPHQLRHPHVERRKSRYQTSYDSLAQCPQEFRDCISELVRSAKLWKEDPSHIARQIWYVVKKRLVDLTRYLEEFSLFVSGIHAKHRRVQFQFMQGSEPYRVSLDPQELLA